MGCTIEEIDIDLGWPYCTNPAQTVSVSGGPLAPATGKDPKVPKTSLAMVLPSLPLHRQALHGLAASAPEVEIWASTSSLRHRAGKLPTDSLQDLKTCQGFVPRAKGHHQQPDPERPNGWAILMHISLGFRV